ncbi:MAG: family 43 glycosylhydrolase [Sphingomonas sp.]
MVPAAAQGTYTNPILYADYSDPDLVRVGQDYYLVASSFHFSPGLPVLRSRDLCTGRSSGMCCPGCRSARSTTCRARTR